MSFFGLNSECEPVRVIRVLYDNRSNPTLHPAIDDEAIVLPLGDNDRVLSEEAGIDITDTVFYFIGDREYQNEDLIEYDNAIHTIKSFVYRKRSNVYKATTKIKNG